MIREIHIKNSCNKTPTFPIKKYIYVNNSIYGAISKNNILIFRGSNNIFEVILQGDIIKEEFYGTKIKEELYYLIKEIIPQIKSEKINYITGWSLGAQLALLTSFYFYKTQNIKIPTIVFGLPRVGNTAFKQAYIPLNNTTYCINNPKDEIINIPFNNKYLNNIFYNDIDIVRPVKCNNNYKFTKRKLKLLNLFPITINYF